MDETLCKCCGVKIEYNSKGIHFRLCTTCTQAVDSFIATRRFNLQKRGLIK